MAIEYGIANGTYTPWPFSAIYNEMQSTIINNAVPSGSITPDDFKSTSVLNALLVSTANQFATVSREIKSLVDNMFVDTARLGYLDRIAKLSGVRRKSAKAATRMTLTFGSSGQGSIHPISTIMVSNGDEGRVFTNTETISIPIYSQLPLSTNPSDVDPLHNPEGRIIPNNVEFTVERDNTGDPVVPFVSMESVRVSELLFNAIEDGPLFNGIGANALTHVELMVNSISLAVGDTFNTTVTSGGIDDTTETDQQVRDNIYKSNFGLASTVGIQVALVNMIASQPIPLSASITEDVINHTVSFIFRNPQHMPVEGIASIIAAVKPAGIKAVNQTYDPIRYVEKSFTDPDHNIVYTWLEVIPQRPSWRVKMRPRSGFSQSFTDIENLLYSIINDISTTVTVRELELSLFAELGNLADVTIQWSFDQGVLADITDWSSENNIGLTSTDMELIKNRVLFVQVN